MKNKNGITLIALVISIIVMLILAGVSINATIGDNGILTKAQDTVFLNSCAYLEEYFNQLYATCAIDGNLEGETPLGVIVKNGYQDYFFSTSEGVSLKKNYVNNETGEIETLALYLVKKDQLPEEIQRQISGADNLENKDYRRVKGVYGITSDLKAYYCEDGIDSILGLTVNDLNADSPDIVYADENSVLAQMINGGTAAITNQGLKTIKILTIDSEDELVLLKDFEKFTNLKTLYFTNLSIDNLLGIEGAANSLNYIKFRNCSVQDYSALCKLTNLNQLYLVRPVDKNEEIVRLCSTDKGIATAEFSNLQYFGIVGGEDDDVNTSHDDYLNSTSTGYCGVRYAITDISGLNNLSDVTKQAIKYMNLQNLQLTSISALKDYINIYFLRLEQNALTSFDGIQNMSNLHYLISPIQYSTTLKKYTLGSNETTTASNTDALSYIYKENGINTSLYYVDLRTNVLKNTSYLNTCEGIRYLYLAGNSNIVDASNIKDVISNCDENYSIDGKYGNELIENTSKTLKLTGTITTSKFETLMNNTNLKQLSLEGITLTTDTGTVLTNTTTPTFNDEINKVLSTCIELRNLKLYNLPNLITIDFIGNGKVTKLLELDLRDTGVINLAVLNTYAQELCSLHLNNNNIDLTTIQDTISRCDGTYQIDEVDTFDKLANYWCGGAGGCNLYTWELISQLPNCTEMTYFKTYNNSWQTLTVDKELDMRNTKLKGWWSSYNRGKLYLPSTLETLEQDGNTLPILAESLDNLVNVSIWKVRELATEEEWNTFFSSLTNAHNLEKIIMGVNENFKFEMLSQLGNLEKLEHFEYFVDDGWKYDSNKDSIVGLGALRNLKTLIIEDLKNVRDISDIKTCTQLEKISITNTQISDISAFEKMSNLREVDLSNNQINNIYALSNCLKLEKLILKNNALTEFGYYINDSGKSIGYEVLNIFYDLNYKEKGSLRYLDISQNTFTDTEILSDLDWPDGKAGFGEE